MRLRVILGVIHIYTPYHASLSHLLTPLTILHYSIRSYILSPELYESRYLHAQRSRRHLEHFPLKENRHPWAAPGRPRRPVSISLRRYRRRTRIQTYYHILYINSCLLYLSKFELSMHFAYLRFSAAPFRVAISTKTTSTTYSKRPNPQRE